MKKLFLLSALALSACAPIAQLAQPGEAKIIQEGLSLLVPNTGVDALTGDPSRQTPGGVLTVSGLGLVPDAEAKTWCTLNTSARWDCRLPEIGAGQRARVTFSSGVINDAVFAGYRASKGGVPVFLFLK
ncbi:hypothetical protein [Deinococcus frigens]|uniref:hypothetical protein n=1 Tax=Deinococcus frigens TaxID=249403 RepID=UPI0004979827|nr:hypothetical protein [Deinococcus frigens]